MTRPGSTDDGPRFLGELLQDFQHLLAQQEAGEKKLAKINEEQISLRKRLVNVEETLRAIGVRESDLMEANNVRKAVLKARAQTYTTIALFTLPLLGTALTWFVWNTMLAIQHQRIDELINGPIKLNQTNIDRLLRDHQPNQGNDKMQGPPVPPRLQQPQP